MSAAPVRQAKPASTADCRPLAQVLARCCATAAGRGMQALTTDPPMPEQASQQLPALPLCSPVHALDDLGAHQRASSYNALQVDQLGQELHTQPGSKKS